MQREKERMIMKKKLTALLLAAVTVGALGLTGCGASGTTENSSEASESASTAEDSSSEAADENLEVIKVGASITPHAEILAQVKDVLKEQGYDLQIVEYNDYVLPNTALEDGDLDANFFQHQPYLDDFNKENNTHLVSVAAVHFEPFGLYAGKTASLDDLQDGATVAVPNDTTNEARALLLLEAQGLIKLKEDRKSVV